MHLTFTIITLKLLECLFSRDIIIHSLNYHLAMISIQNEVEHV